MRLAPLLVAVLARLSLAQANPPGITVSGVVRDSIARSALVSARVQLVAADDPTRFGRVAVSDSLGRFSIDSVPPGRYMIGFFHPMLDSLALDPPLREVVVRGSASVQADLAIPSPARLRAAFCGPKQDSAGVIVGVLRDAGDHTVTAGATVLAEWLELSASGRNLNRTIARSMATTRDNGWFTLCNLPSSGTLALSAKRGGDIVDRVDVVVPVGGFARRDLYVGAARVVAANDAPRADSVVAAPRRVLAGDGILRGTVVSITDGQPVTGAHVRILDGPQTETNARGEWTLSGAPLGTRMLEVRAISYLPDRRTVDVVSNATPIGVVLSTVSAMLDTVRVAGARREARDMVEFEERRRTGHGRFLSIDDIAKQKPSNTTDMFQRIVGMRIDRQVVGSDSLYVRGAIDDWCVPSIWVDGAYMGELAADDINAVAAPADLTGIEIYTGSSTPARFQRGLSGCGTVVIWTKLRNRSR